MTIKMIGILQVVTKGRVSWPLTVLTMFSIVGNRK